MSREELAQVVEAFLFSSPEPLHPAQMCAVCARVTGEVGPAESEIEEIVTYLNERYERMGAAVRIQRWAGGFSMATVPGVAPFVEELALRERPRALSRSLMETLAIISYKQPVSKAELDFVRGVDSDYTVRKLLEMGLVDVVGRSDSLGRPLLYGTTPRFLDQFGLSGLEELPELREIEELLNDPGFSKERAKLLLGDDGGTGVPPDSPAQKESE